MTDLDWFIRFCDVSFVLSYRKSIKEKGNDMFRLVPYAVSVS